MLSKSYLYAEKILIVFCQIKIMQLDHFARNCKKKWPKAALSTGFFFNFQVQTVQPLNVIDYIASILFLTLLVTETCADQQQWNFQNQKYALKNAGKDLVPPYDVGFIRSGMDLDHNKGTQWY